MPISRRFTGKERDTESGNDYFGARYYASSMGRWMSPDYQNLDDDDTPEAIPNGSTGNPQSLNLYAYGRNNPLNRRDFDGHASWGPCANDSSSQCWNGDYNGELDCSGSGGCLFWNGSSNQWQPNDPTPPPPDDPIGFFMTGLMRASIAHSWGDFKYGLRQMVIAPVATLIAGGGNPVLASFIAVRPLFVPKNWTEKPSRKGEGTKWQDPENPHNSVRVMKGQPGNSNPGQQQDYIVIRKDGQTLDRTGTPSDDPATTHIPVGTDIPTTIFEGPGGGGAGVP